MLAVTTSPPWKVIYQTFSVFFLICTKKGSATPPVSRKSGIPTMQVRPLTDPKVIIQAQRGHAKVF